MPGEYKITDLDLIDMADNMPPGDYRLGLEYYMNNKLGIRYKIYFSILAGKLKALVKTIEQDESYMEYADFRGLKNIKFNKTYSGLSGKLKIFKGYATSKVNFKLAKKMGNGYIPMSMLDLKNQDYCEMVKNPIAQKTFFVDLAKYSTLPNTCDYEPGDYVFTYFVPEVPENTPTGDFRAEMEQFIDGKPIIKYKAYLTIS
ncbi:uncharacterized protein LOC123290405 [Chrysoperla carnea]|uniref:uncharacterized protein LOC123290405 n=1 Tax=Chrysoperla carnea TaxID=189513 RepID=UPI001D08961B|nr:uncharacterized protein LOC123290405 [Chrysoperla carnea]